MLTGSPQARHPSSYNRGAGAPYGLQRRVPYSRENSRSIAGAGDADRKPPLPCWFLPLPKARISREGLFLMPEHIKKKLQEEIKLLEHELTHELPAEIKKAVAMGDLSENAEYHMAKQRQTFVNARLGQLKRRMAELSLVNLSNIPRGQAGFGSTVVVFDSTKDEEIVYRLVTSEESDVSKGLISTTSPIGRGL